MAPERRWVSAVPTGTLSQGGLGQKVPGRATAPTLVSARPNPSLSKNSQHRAIARRAQTSVATGQRRGIEPVFRPHRHAETCACDPVRKNYLPPFAGRPVLMVARRRSTARTAVSLNLARFATAARKISLFFAGTPAFMQRFLSRAIKAYSSSGIVKLSRTNLAFFALGALAALAVGLAPADVVIRAGFFAGGVFLATVGRLTGFFAPAPGALLPVGEPFRVGFAGTDGVFLTALGRGTGLAASDGLSLPVITDFVSGGVVSGCVDLPLPFIMMTLHFA